MEENLEQAGTAYLADINKNSFKASALALFRQQCRQHTLYGKFVSALGIDPEKITSLTAIPFLPISFFKTHRVLSDNREYELYFESSGTTGDIPARHYVASRALYEMSLLKGFRQFYGAPEQYTILALLPSYLERSHASLVHMVSVLMRESGQKNNGFYLHEWAQLAATLQQLEAAGRKTLLLGVTFALLDFAKAFPMPLRHTIVMETGGMKGRKEEWIRAQVHQQLKTAWNLKDVHAEYGMTELLSQAYSTADGIFAPAATMKVLAGDLHDPLDVQYTGTGRLHIIDLANVHSCAFLATEDTGTVFTDGRFTVLGRIDHSALRGCSLMVV